MGCYPRGDRPLYVARKVFIPATVNVYDASVHLEGREILNREAVRPKIDFRLPIPPGIAPKERGSTERLCLSEVIPTSAGSTRNNRSRGNRGEEEEKKAEEEEEDES